MRTDGRTDMKKLIVAFRNFAKSALEETNIHALSGIRTRDPSIRAPADLRLKPYARRLLLDIFIYIKCYIRSERHDDSKLSVHANCCPGVVMRAVRIKPQQQDNKRGVSQQRNQIFARSHNVSSQLQFCNHGYLIQQAISQQKMMPGTYTVVTQ